MTTAIPTTNPADRLAERLFGATVGALELYSVYLGAELGLYAALRREGPLTAAGLAGSAGIAPRYAREWLEQQAVAGLIDVLGADLDAERRRYALPADHARVLDTPGDPAHAAPFAHMLAGIGRALPAVAQAYRTGGGVPYADYGAAFRHGQGHINRPAFTEELPGPWLEALPDVRARLARGGRVADLGCGHGWSAIALAHAFPHASVDGFDLDAASVADARRHAADAGVGRRVRFSRRDAADIAGEGPYDLVLLLEALHDLPLPVETLAAARAALAPGGVVLVVDERVADRFVAPGDDVERMMYGWSVTHCLPTQLVDQPSAALGTVMRADTVRALAAEAGFREPTQLAVENELFRLYRLEV